MDCAYRLDSSGPFVLLWLRDPLVVGVDRKPDVSAGPSGVCKRRHGGSALAWICRSIFELRIRLCFVLGFLGAVDPFQLVWERYVMTETISLFFYVAGLYFSFLYLKHRRIRHLAILHGLSVFLIAFRMSYLLVVQLNTVLPADRCLLSTFIGSVAAAPNRPR